MRTLMRESLFLLLASAGPTALDPGFQAEHASRGLSYADLASLRPQYADSSWRGTLNRLVEQRYVFKRLSGSRVTFQLTRLGEEWTLQNLFSGLMAAEEERLSLVLLRPLKKRRQSYGRARRLLEERGYLGVIPGVYVTQSGGYSDLLWQNLQDAGFLSVFLRLPVDGARPIRLTEFLASINEQQVPQREWKRISGQVDELLSITLEQKELSPADKKRLGEMVVSGLGLASDWSPFWASEGLARDQIQSLVGRLFQIMRYLPEITQ